MLPPLARIAAAALVGATVVGAALVTAPPCVAQHAAVTIDQHGLTLPAGEFSIADMVTTVGRYLGRNYLFDPGQLDPQRPLQLQRALQLDAIGSEELLCALLTTRGLTALPLDEARGVYHVLPLDADPTGSLPIAAIPWRTPREIEGRPGLQELALTAVTLDHLDARQVATALHVHFANQRTWRPGAPAVAAAGERLLLLHGFRNQLAETLRMLHLADTLATPAPVAPSVAQLQQRVEQLERELAELRAELRRESAARGR